MLVARHRSRSESEFVRKQPFPLDAKTILDLQRAAGNRFVGTLLRPRPSPSPVAAQSLEPGASLAESQPARLESVRPHPTHGWVWAILIGALAAVAAFAALAWKLPQLSRPGAIAAAVCCGAVAFLCVVVFVPQVRPPVRTLLSQSSSIDRSKR